MEWIEVTGDSVEDAKSVALEKLGVHDSEADFEIIESPSSKLFGLRKTQARVRARVRPVAPAPKRERGDRRGVPAARSPATSVDQRRPTARANHRTAAVRENATAAGISRAETVEIRAKPQGEGGGKRSRPKAQPKPEKQESPMEEVETAVRDFLAGLATSFGLDDTPVLDISEGVIEASLAVREGVLIGPKGAPWMPFRNSPGSPLNEPHRVPLASELMSAAIGLLAPRRWGSLLARPRPRSEMAARKLFWTP